MKNPKNKKISTTIIRNTLNILISFTLSLIVLILFMVLALGAHNPFEPRHFNPVNYTYVLIFVILIVNILFSLFANTKISKKINELEEATLEVSKGNFNVQVKATNNEFLDSYIENFNKMVRELRGMETLKSDFISNVSHEFKTPLSVIQAYSKALRKKNLSAEKRAHYEEVIDNNISKLTNLTTNILLLSKIENQSIVPNKEEYMLDEQIRQSILGLETEWKKKNITFDLDLKRTNYYGAQELMSQVWQNLINNAIKFSNENGKISISILENEESIEVTVADNGIGMTEEVMKNIFDKFYQGDSSHSTKGNGLGLALVKRILNITDGEISVKSEPNKGSTFVVKLKKIDPPQEVKSVEQSKEC